MRHQQARGKMVSGTFSRCDVVRPAASTNRKVERGDKHGKHGDRRNVTPVFWSDRRWLAQSDPSSAIHSTPDHNVP